MAQLSHTARTGCIGQGHVLGPPDPITGSSVLGPPDPLTTCSVYGPPDPCPVAADEARLSDTS